MTQSLNPITYGNKLRFSSSNISNTLEVFRKLRLRKCKYKEYIITIMQIQRVHNYNNGWSVFDNLSNIQLRIEHSQLNLFCYINSAIKYF